MHRQELVGPNNCVIINAVESLLLEYKKKEKSSGQAIKRVLSLYAKSLCIIRQAVLYCFGFLTGGEKHTTTVINYNHVSTLWGRGGVQIE